jgi:hypothetical protein
VLDAGDNVPAQLRISQILQFNPDSHCIAILSEWCIAQQPVQTGQSCAGWPSQALPRMTYSQFLLIKMRIDKKQLRHSSENGKGCDIGYAPSASSCERANSVDACTVAALDVITAFAVPNPNGPSQDSSVFSGLDALQVALPSLSLSLLRTGFLNCANPFSRRRSKTKQLLQ